jgi:uncharacterized protein with GYD domain
MPKFLVLLQYTSEGSKILLKEKVSARETAARKAIESIGGKVESIYFTASGEYHLAMTAEYPNAATAAAVIATMVSLGAVAIHDCRQKACSAACRAEWVGKQLDKLIEDYGKLKSEDEKLDGDSRRSKSPQMPT